MLLPEESPFQWQAQNGRRALLRRIRARFGRHLARVLDPEDVLQESLLTALRSTRGCWQDSLHALGAFLHRISDLRLRHEGRRAALRDARPLAHEPAGPQGTARATKRGPLGGLLEREIRLRGDHRWSLFLKEWMSSPWDTSAFVLDRPTTWAARSLHRRARGEIATALEER
jgi:DNA-directed RNA polymerase specialized sigma24 family protein